MNHTPVNKNLVDQAISQLKNPDLGTSTIREIVRLVNQLEEQSGVKFMRMEMGVPGLKPPQIGTDAEIEALKNGVASDYPMLDGIKPLKEETARFVKNFMDIDILPTGCIPTVGSMQGSFVSFLLASNLYPEKDTALFIDPGFSVQKVQFKVMGHKFDHFDVYHHRGPKLRAKLEEHCAKGNINSIIYSNPNNPSWICLTPEELAIIGDIANKYNLIVIEDLAYFGMDFRHDLSKPGKPPYQPTVAKYTSNYIILISSSKAFSYAGQRIAMLCISNALYARDFDTLKNRFGVSTLGQCVIQRLIYATSSGTSHSPQYAMYAMLKAANSGQFNFIDDVKEYGRRAAAMKKIFTNHGFYIVYDKDLDHELADGFYFTIAYPGMDTTPLLTNLLYYGISAIGLINCGSEHTGGLRACVSQIKPENFDELEKRIKQFNNDFPIR